MCPVLTVKCASLVLPMINAIAHRRPTAAHAVTVLAIPSLLTSQVLDQIINSVVAEVWKSLASEEQDKVVAGSQTRWPPSHVD